MIKLKIKITNEVYMFYKQIANAVNRPIEEILVATLMKNAEIIMRAANKNAEIL